MKGFVLGIAATILVIAAVVYGYLAFGFAPVATSAAPMLLEKKFARMALHSRLLKEMPRQAPIQANDTNLAAGAHIYVEQCSICHGLPGKEQSPIARGEFPRPPHLFRGKGVTDDEPGETYWKVANGIRMTGMPGYSKQLSETEMWQLSLLLANANKLPDSVKLVLANETSISAPEALAAQSQRTVKP